MKPTNWKYSAILALIAVVVCVETIAQEQEIGDFEELTLQISTAQQKVLPLEPIEITITLSNDTDKPVKGEPVINPGAGFLKIYVAKAGETFQRFRSTNWMAWSLVRGAADRVVDPGFCKTLSTYLYYAHPANLEKERHGRYVIEMAGIYHIKASLEDGSREHKIESNVLTVEAKEPKGQDAGAYEYLRSLRDIKDADVSYGRFLMDTAGRHYHPRRQKVLDKQEEFISKFPRSRYARYARYSLGRTYRWQESEQKIQRGIDLLEEAAGYKDFLFAKEAARVLIETFVERGEEEKAEKYKVLLAERFPDSEEGRDYAEKGYADALGAARFPWPLVLVGVAAAVFVFGLLMPLLIKKAKVRSK